MTVHVGFTGTQAGMTYQQDWRVSELLTEIGASDLTHGDCIGADNQADQLARELGLRRHIRPSTLKTKRAHCIPADDDIVHEPKPPLERNHDIVDEVEVMIAAPKELTETLRSGTWATVRHARKVGKPVWIVWPDGTVSTPYLQ